MRNAGSELAAAALRVTEDYDGVHRLRLAVAKWAKVTADEGGRGATQPEEPRIVYCHTCKRMLTCDLPLTANADGKCSEYEPEEPREVHRVAEDALSRYLAAGHAVPNTDGFLRAVQEALTNERGAREG
jgi:hypothetical protein